MPLKIHFTETFTGQTVRLRAPGVDLPVADLVTDPRISRARVVDLELPAGPQDLTVALEPGGPAVSATVDAGKLAFLLVELTPAGLQLAPVTRAEQARSPRGFA
jgi:hypothetical protein